MFSQLRIGGNLKDLKRILMEKLRSEIWDDRVMWAMDRVPRECFMPVDSRHMAYQNIPFPIGSRQTISQPLMVALMVQALELKQSHKVLELGTGTGYGAAVLAELACKVITVERISSLAYSAAERLSKLGYVNVEVMLAGDTLGWEKQAPYDAIVVTAGVPKLLDGLLQQMADGGMMVIPVGSLDQQELIKVSKSEEGYSVKSIGLCRFVPLIGDGAWSENQV